MRYVDAIFLGKKVQCDYDAIRLPSLLQDFRQQRIRLNMVSVSMPKDLQVGLKYRPLKTTYMGASLLRH